MAFLYVIDRIKKRIDRLYGENVRFAEDEGADHVIARITGIESTIRENEPRIQLLESIAAMSVQKVGFVRFNPFSDTGGDNSFALALLDYRNNGVVLSSLYARDGVRVYAKHIENGEARHQLSKEEMHALQRASATQV